MTSPAKAARIEAAAQVTIMLTMGVTAAAASFTHIHDLTVRYGQQSWMGWANAVVVELMSIAAGLELRRRKRTGQHTGFVYAVLCAAALVSLAAQVAEAEPSVWGWIVAALPALGFLAVVKIVLSRSPAVSGPDQITATPIEPDPRADQRTDSAVRSAGPGPDNTPWTGPTDTPRTGPVQLADRTVDLSPPAAPPVQTADEPSESPIGNSEHRVPTSTRIGARPKAAAHRPGSTTATTTRAGRTPRQPEREQAGPHSPDEQPAELLDVARSVAANLQKTEGKITRNGLARGIRREGHSVSTDRASDLWRRLQTEAPLVSSP